MNSMISKDLFIRH